MPRHVLIRPSAIAAAIAMLASGAAQSFEIDTGNPDAVLRWDTTIRYNLGARTQAQDPAILANPNYDDGDRNFGKGKLVANRLDLLTEADIVINKRWGGRLSAALWADAAYSSLDNTNNATANTLVDGVPTAGVLSPYAKRYAKGPSGEVLDAFVFTNLDVGGMPLSVRAGKHTAYWGESLFGGGAVHGISYGQYSLDLWKGLATPGIEAKELFRPRNSITAQLSTTPELSIAAQTFFGWEAVRYPESGSYLTVNDALLFGGQSLVAGPGQRLLQIENAAPKKTGDWGLSARWSPYWLDGTAGAYLRRTTDIQPQLTVTPAVASLPAATCMALGLTPLGATTCYVNPAAATVPQIMTGQVGQYQAHYGSNIDMLGFSLSKNVSGISLGAELSYRHNMPLQSTLVTVLPAALVNAALGQVATTAIGDGTPGARGNTLHGVFNLLSVLPKSGWYDTASWSTELVFNQWLSVTHNPGAFKGSDAYRADAANVDAVTKTYLGLGVNFEPTWFQVLPGVDLSMPLSWSGGIKGNSAVTSGGNQGAGSYAIGVAADVNSKYNFSLRYTGFYGNYSRTASGAMNVPNDTSAALSDRGNIMLTIKATF